MCDRVLDPVPGSDAVGMEMEMTLRGVARPERTGSIRSVGMVSVNRGRAR